MGVNCKVMECNCENTQQDNLHGKRRRVFNKMTKQDNTWRCTVCSKEVVKGESKKK